MINTLFEKKKICKIGLPIIILSVCSLLGSVILIMSGTARGLIAMFRPQGGVKFECCVQRVPENRCIVHL